MEPLPQTKVDIFLARIGIASAQVLAHQLQPCFEQVERGAKGVGE
jgi:hypothetical protein